MTDEEINIKIAEARGLTDLPFRRCPLTGDLYYGTTLVPDACNDLNVMHETEKTLRNQFNTVEDAYWRNLSHVKPHPIYATARQRAEAFLRTLGLWTE